MSAGGIIRWIGLTGIFEPMLWESRIDGFRFALPILRAGWVWRRIGRIRPFTDVSVGVIIRWIGLAGIFEPMMWESPIDGFRFPLPMLRVLFARQGAIHPSLGPTRPLGGLLMVKRKPSRSDVARRRRPA